MHIKATITNIDLNPEFADLLDIEATITVTFKTGKYSNEPLSYKVISITKSDALQYSLGQIIPLMHW